MSVAIVVFRANRQEEEKPIQYNKIDSVQPFGAQAIAIGTADGTIILPWGRIKEVILPTDKAHDTATAELPEIIMPDAKGEITDAEFEEVAAQDVGDALVELELEEEPDGSLSASTSMLQGESE